MKNELLLRHIQALAIHFVSYVGPLPALAGFVKHSMGEMAPPISLIELALRRESVQKELAVSYETALFTDTRGHFHLVNIAPERDPEVARRRLNRYPDSPSQCRFCYQDSRTLSHLELVPELDIHGHPVHRSRLHKQCLRPWLQMRDLVEHADKKVTA
jgi:hypothetical protein